MLHGKDGGIWGGGSGSDVSRRKEKRQEVALQSWGGFCVFGLLWLFLEESREPFVPPFLPLETNYKLITDSITAAAGPHLLADFVSSLPRFPGNELSDHPQNTPILEQHCELILVN